MWWYTKKAAGVKVLPQHMTAPQQSEFCNYGTIMLCFFFCIYSYEADKKYPKPFEEGYIMLGSPLTEKICSLDPAGLSPWCITLHLFSFHMLHCHQNSPISLSAAQPVSTVQETRCKHSPTALKFNLAALYTQLKIKHDSQFILSLMGAQSFSVHSLYIGWVLSIYFCHCSTGFS